MPTTQPLVKETRLLLSEPERRAVRAGRKTQFRVIVEIPSWGTGDIELCDKSGMGQIAIDWPNVICKKTSCLAEIPCPFGWRGDRLWVPEPWCEYDGYLFYRDTFDPEADEKGDMPWRSSTSMPKWVARDWLEIVDVRAERVQNISNDDARCEGVPEWEGDEPGDYLGSFREQWDEKHGPGSWERNDWLFAISFKRVEGAA